MNKKNFPIPYLSAQALGMSISWDNFFILF